jgi:hypothetical protein
MSTEMNCCIQAKLFWKDMQKKIINHWKTTPMSAAALNLATTQQINLREHKGKITLLLFTGIEIWLIILAATKTII